MFLVLDVVVLSVFTKKFLCISFEFFEGKPFVFRVRISYPFYEELSSFTFSFMAEYGFDFIFFFSFYYVRGWLGKCRAVFLSFDERCDERSMEDVVYLPLRRKFQLLNQIG